MQNADTLELRKFDALASRWWDPEGEFAPLHKLNPLRTAFVAERATLAGSRVLDIGCGGGLLTESMARAGADVTGIDMAPGPLAVARLHQQQSGLTGISYIETSAEALLAESEQAFDIVTCMEVIEHVPDPESLVKAIASLVQPGGDVFLSTLNRNLKSFLLAIVAAEYVANLLPRGTHDYARFIRPSELRRWGQSAGLEFAGIAGLSYAPLSGTFSLGNDVNVNYLMHLHRPA
jgi:2-polyprenyl-6-hydroxyphenyl methylase/3-demethylubiquinone-9 3-methyltransferase